MTVTLREGDPKAFFEAPFNAYPESVGYVSALKGDVLKMLDPDRNPLWKSGNPFRFWTVHRSGKPMGRIIAHLHRQSNERWGANRCQFGIGEQAQVCGKCFCNFPGANDTPPDFVSHISDLLV